MRDQFVADINDFGKYGLLRSLCGITGLAEGGDRPPDLSLGVVWYYRPPEADITGGDNIGYLFDAKQQASYRVCDPTLWDTLRELVCGNQRTVMAVEGLDFLRVGGRYFRANIPVHASRPAGRNSRDDKKQAQEHAEQWLEEATGRVRGADLVFLDPDRKIAGPTDPKQTSKHGPLYAHSGEIKALWEAGHSLVIYHQTASSPVGNDTVSGAAKRLRQELGYKPVALHFHPSRRKLIFFIIPHPHHREIIDGRINRCSAVRGESISSSQTPMVWRRDPLSAMQNKYVSDAADYGKLGLLRYLCGETDPDAQGADLRLGVVWYMHPDQHGPDGRHTGYLTPSYKNIQKYGVCDPGFGTECAA